MVTGKVRWVLLVAVAALMAACGGDDGDAAVPSAELITSWEPVPFEADASPLTAAFSPVDPGTYRVDSLGTPFSFTIDESLHVRPNGRGGFVLTHPASNGPDDRDIVILRLSSLSDPTEAQPWPTEVDQGWPAADLDGWLDALSDHLVVSNRAQATIGGLDATFLEVHVGEVDCPLGHSCALFGTNHVMFGKILGLRSSYRIWMVDQAGEDPLAVVVAVNREADVGWFEAANEVLSTLAFGDIGANPVSTAGGPTELTFLGGIRADLAEGSIVIQEPGGFGATTPDPAHPGDIEFLLAPNDASGSPVTTTDQAIEVLEAANVEVTEIDAAEVGGLATRVLEIGSAAGPPLLTRAPDTEVLWTPPPRGRLWLIEHPDRGLLVITAEAFAEPDTVFPVMLAEAESIIASLEFIELG